MNFRLIAIGLLFHGGVLASATAREVDSPGAAVPNSAPRTTAYVDEAAGGTYATFRKSYDETVSERAYADLIAEWLGERKEGRPTVGKVDLGRVINFPWISKYMARRSLRHPQWNAKTGSCREGHENRLVESFLMNEGFRTRLEAPFAESGYRIRSVSVEKVLIGKLGNVHPEFSETVKRVPYDAIVTLALEKVK